MVLERVAFTSLVLAFALLSSHSTNASPIHPLCKLQQIAEIRFEGLEAVPDSRNFCASYRPIPPAVASLIEEIGQQNRAVTKVLGLSGSELLGEGVPLLFSAYAGGTVHSYALRDGTRILMTAFPEEDLTHFSKKVYAHELVHFIIYRKTKLTKALAGFENHPFIEEAFPDLVSLTANEDSVMTFDDAGLPECLRNQRDGTPLQSLNLPQKDFHFLAATEQLVACCNRLRDDEKTPGVLALCAEDRLDPDLYKTIAKIGVDIHEPTEAELNQPFEPKACIRRVKGIATLDNCNSRQFSKVLVSFFFSLEKRLARPLVPLFVQTLLDTLPERSTHKCEYLTPQPTQKASLTVGSLSKVLQTFRSRLHSEAEKLNFDQLWDRHAFDKLAELDHIYATTNLNALALPILAKANLEFQAKNGCSATYTAKPSCALKCL